MVSRSLTRAIFRNRATGDDAGAAREQRTQAQTKGLGARSHLPMKIATWNINGVRARIDSLMTWLKEASPDVVCLQETKLADDAFAELLGADPRICSSIIGRADAVLALWGRLGGHWGPARDVRPNQPLLVSLERDQV